MINIDQNNYIETLSEGVHNALMQEKLSQGFHAPNNCSKKITNAQVNRTLTKFTKHCDKCHTDLYLYSELPEHIKEYDRVTVRSVLAAQEKLKTEEYFEIQTFNGSHLCFCKEGIPFFLGEEELVIFKVESTPAIKRYVNNER